MCRCHQQASRCLCELINIDNLYFEQMVCQIYPTELLSKNPPNSFGTEALFLEWDLFRVRHAFLSVLFTVESLSLLYLLVIS